MVTIPMIVTVTKSGQSSVTPSGDCHAKVTEKTNQSTKNENTKKGIQNLRLLLGEEWGFGI
jgi:hypothetical protein